MIHVFEKGTNNKLIVALHGHGGHATQLFDLARFIDPHASLLGIQGDVEENGMKRYFERYTDGSFNTKSLAKATKDVYETVQDAIQKYDLDGTELILLGYSNGANVLQSMLKMYALDAKAVLLFHPSVTLKDIPFIKQTVPVFVTYGSGDTYISGTAFSDLTKQMKEEGLNITVYTSDYGHQLIQEELQTAKKFILSNQ